MIFSGVVLGLIVEVSLHYFGVYGFTQGLWTGIAVGIGVFVSKETL